jgi:hypothetical protein
VEVGADLFLIDIAIKELSETGRLTKPGMISMRVRFHVHASSLGVGTFQL